MLPQAEFFIAFYGIETCGDSWEHSAGLRCLTRSDPPCIFHLILTPCPLPCYIAGAGYERLESGSCRCRKDREHWESNHWAWTTWFRPQHWGGPDIWRHTSESCVLLSITSLPWQQTGSIWRSSQLHHLLHNWTLWYIVSLYLEQDFLSSWRCNSYFTPRA